MTAIAETSTALASALQIGAAAQRAQMLTQLPDGLHVGVSAYDYHAPMLGMVSKGALDEISRSPAHYRAWLDGDRDEDTASLSFGRAFHCAVLEPEVFSETYAVEPAFGDCRNKENKARRDAWRAEHAGREILSLDDMETIVGMSKSVRSHPMAGAALREGEAELTALWTDPETGLRCRSRADWYVRRLRTVFDLKTTQDAREQAFGRSAFTYRYHWQHALYRMGFAALKEDVQHFAFIAVEKREPYAIRVYTLDDRAVSLAYRDVRQQMATMRTCLEKNEWPAYEGGVSTLFTPSWMT